jgi:hypothetical protein
MTTQNYFQMCSIIQMKTFWINRQEIASLLQLDWELRLQGFIVVDQPARRFSTQLKLL